MDLEMKIDGIELRDISDEWLSVAAKRRFSKGEVIEVCPIVVLNQNDSSLVEKTNLVRLCFRIGKKLAVSGGYGSCYLPSESPNADFKVFPKQRAAVVYASREIKSGELIHVNRGVIPDEPQFDYNRSNHLHSDGLIVKPSLGKGLGTFTTRRFEEGEYVEICGLYYLTEKESNIIAETDANAFMYAWGSKDQLSGWAMGYSCFYNHSENPNITPWDEIDSLDYSHLAVRALKDLEPGTELVFDYAEGYKKKELGFKVR